MSINKSYVLAGAAIAATSIVSMTNISTVEAASQIATVTENVNFRTGPDKSYPSMGKIEKGETVTYLGISGNWIKVTYNSKTGYVYKDYISTVSTSNTVTSTSVKYVNSSSGLNVRKGPSTSYSKVTTLANGTKVTVNSTSNGWSKITSGNVTGYVSSSYLQSTVPSGSTSNSGSNNSVSASASSVIAYAKTLLGKPYVWGAQGPNSFDCSGFTYYVFKNAAGITLPRTSSAQSKYGTYVSKSNLKAGDLIFFDTVGPNNGAVTHVGIYIGNGQFIHAASGQGKVVINNLNSTYYVNAYVNARRVL